MIKQIWYAPSFASLITGRAETLALAGVGAVQLGLHMAGIPAWPCPFRAVTGLPCPGCGLTTAIGQFVRGHFGNSLETHAFAPIFLLAFAVILAAAALPEKPRATLLTRLAWVETKTGITAWVLSALMIYWTLRLLGFAPFI